MNDDNRSCEREYDFALILDGVSKITPELANRVFEAGCADATLGMQRGVVQLEFSRVATSLKDAALSAIGDVSKVGMGITVREVDDCNTIGEAVCNARLIAAAPELLQALTDLLRETSNGTDLCTRLFADQAAAAIRKATGV